MQALEYPLLVPILKFLKSKKKLTKGYQKVRYNKRKLKSNKTKILPIEFVKQPITSYSGLQLVKYYMELIGLYRRIKGAFREFTFNGDYNIADLIIVMLLIRIIGLQRLRHLEYISDDPLFQRVIGLAMVPHRTTIARGFAQFTSDALKTLIELNGELVMHKIDELGLRTLTVDLDGSVISTTGNAAFHAYALA